MLGALLFCALFLVTRLSAQEQFTLDTWTTNNVQPKSAGNCPNNNQCFEVSESGYAVRTFSTIGYESIQLRIDIGEDDLEGNDRCKVEYTSAAISGYLTLISRDSGGLNIMASLPDNAGVNDREDLTIRLQTDASDDEAACYFDELELWGVKITTAPTVDPTHEPSAEPTAEPTADPTLEPSWTPTSHEGAAGEDLEDSQDTLEGKEGEIGLNETGADDGSPLVMIVVLLGIALCGMLLAPMLWVLRKRRITLQHTKTTSALAINGTETATGEGELETTQREQTDKPRAVKPLCVVENAEAVKGSIANTTRDGSEHCATKGNSNGVMHDEVDEIENPEQEQEQAEAVEPGDVELVAAVSQMTLDAPKKPIKRQTLDKDKVEDEESALVSMGDMLTLGAPDQDDEAEGSESDAQQLLMGVMANDEEPEQEPRMHYKASSTNIDDMFEVLEVVNTKMGGNASSDSLEVGQTRR